VIRSNGERTKDLCARLLREQIEAECIEIAPFTEAVRRCFEIAIEAKADWLLTVDADVLVFPKAVEKMINRTAEMPKQVFHFQGMIRDKLSRKVRNAGHRMYRVKYLPQLLPLIEDVIRVESNIVRRFRAAGFKSITLDDIFGYHDYEQWYADLYRKASVHAKKHRWWDVRYWKDSGDMDLCAAYAGWHGLPWDAPEKQPLTADFDWGRMF
jgi:hypothetical protein